LPIAPSNVWNRVSAQCAIELLVDGMGLGVNAVRYSLCNVTQARRIRECDAVLLRYVVQDGQNVSL
jgi:hypothetical protein